MTAPKRLPGPWAAIQDDNGTWWIRQSSGPGLSVACVGHENVDAIAKLMAASPELFESLEALLPMAEDNVLSLGRDPNKDGSIIRARLALASAIPGGRS